MGMDLLVHASKNTGKAGAESVPRRYTYSQLRAELPETNQLGELWEGQLVMSPSPSFYHQQIVFCFQRALHDWVRARGLGQVVGAPIDMVLSEHRTTQPDVAFIARERLGIIHDAILGPADLVAEVISLGSRTRDRIEKRDLYEQYGVQEYWIIDPESQSADVLFLENGTYRLAMRCGIGEAAESRLLPGFRVELRPLFEAE
jgi:Uma2 family endonuclease